MRIFLLVTLGLGLAVASPLGKMKPLPEVEFTDPESGEVKAKLNKLHQLLAELSSQVGDAKVKVKNEQARDLQTSGKLEDPFFKDLDPSDVAFLKGIRTYMQGLKDKLEDQQKVEQKREQAAIPDDVKELLEKYRSRVKYLRAALDDEKVNAGKPNPDDVHKKNVDGAFGQFDNDKEKKDEWQEQPLREDLLGAKTALNEVEKRLLDDLKYARDQGVDVRQILQDLKQKKDN